MIRGQNLLWRRMVCVSVLFRTCFELDKQFSKVMKCNNIYYYHLEFILFYTQSSNHSVFSTHFAVLGCSVVRRTSACWVTLLLCQASVWLATQWCVWLTCVVRVVLHVFATRYTKGVSRHTITVCTDRVCPDTKNIVRSTTLCWYPDTLKLFCYR